MGGGRGQRLREITAQKAASSGGGAGWALCPLPRPCCWPVDLDSRSESSSPARCPSKCSCSGTRGWPGSGRVCICSGPAPRGTLCPATSGAFMPQMGNGSPGACSAHPGRGEQSGSQLSPVTSHVARAPQQGRRKGTRWHLQLTGRLLGMGRTRRSACPAPAARQGCTQTPHGCVSMTLMATSSDLST